MQVDKDAGLSCDMLSFNRICRLSCYVCPKWQLRHTPMSQY